jgi:myo-inositol-1(or 4)-monophosphatase
VLIFVAYRHLNCWLLARRQGTANFASGLELCAVTMGIAYEGTPVVGVVYDPHRNHMYSAIRGMGATCNGVPISVSPSTRTVDEAIINAGCPADPNAFAASIRGIVALNKRCRGVRMVACSALTLAWIASGQLSAHFGYDLSSWDLIAGALLVQEAGGRITDLDGTPYRLETRSMLCSNAAVHDEILQILTDADAVSFTRSL